jgi:hypothetical protein
MSVSSQSLQIFAKDTLIKGQPGQIECVDILGQTFTITRGPLTVVSLEDEWYDDLRDPETVIAALREQRDVSADVLTFWQRLPDIMPKFSYHQEWDEIAVLPSKSYADWWNNHIKSRVRSQIRKAEKEGVVVKECPYDDDFVRGMTAIFNEAAVRQGRRFWHYGKDFDTVKHQFARYIHREHMIGAYYRDEMIGLIMLGNAGTFGLTGQIISSIKHRDKATNNALVAKAVEVRSVNSSAAAALRRRVSHATTSLSTRRARWASSSGHSAAGRRCSQGASSLRSSGFARPGTNPTPARRQRGLKSVAVRCQE